MDHPELISRVLREIVSARTAITAGYQHLWRRADIAPADRDDAQPSVQRTREPANDDGPSPAEPDLE
ncbi:MAG: hypothetical protein ACRDK2_16125 [Solirubrobacteraceae bacterium]